VNDAGRGEFGRLWESDRERLDAAVRLNAVALLRLAHAALGPMLGRGRGALINVSSTASFVPCPGYAVYGATKAFVNSLSEALHEELRGTGVRVQALCPGLTQTRIFEAAGADVSALPRLLWMTPEAVVEESLAALARGRVVCVPGLGNRTLASLVRLLPHAASAPVAAALTRRLVARAGRTPAPRRRRAAPVPRRPR
jgi:short-subunit dehydrogenase